MQDLDQALEDEKSASIKETKWTKIQRRVASTIRLALAPEIKHNMLKETTPKALWKKLENISASKSLSNRFCLKMKLYQLKIEMGGDLHDHIKALVQTLLVGRLTLNMDEVTATLRENKRMMRTENIDDEHNVIIMVEYERGRNHSRRHDGLRGRSKSQLRLQ
ncbi:Retrovirus-related Pol polyprotein from transposon TNT 1-94 [Glycine soja]